MEPILTEDRAGNLLIWDHPIKDRDYVAGIDAAENKRRDRSAVERRTRVNYSDDRADYSSITVLEMESALHVASWHGYCPPDELAVVAAAIGYYYNRALLVPEINGPGFAVVTKLGEVLRYPNIYRTQFFNVLDRDPYAPQLGFQTNTHSRKILMSRVNEALNTHRILTRDAALISELRTMEYDDQGNERARGKNKDDRVFSFALALEGRHQQVAQRGGTMLEVPRDPKEAYANRVWAHVEKELEESEHARNRRGGNHPGGLGLPVWCPRPGG